MSEIPSHSEVIAGLAEDFVARYRNGERPPVSEYTDKHPELAEEIREFFGAVAMVENLAPAASESTGGARSGAPSGMRTKVVPPFTLLGDYRILKEIGRGGMGVVYEAEQVSLGRHVALKVLPLHVAKDARLLERFRREVRAAAKLHHSNIVPVFEAGEADDVRFYAMQYIQGQSLDTVIDELRRMRTGEPAPLPRDGFDRQVSGTEPESFANGARSSNGAVRPEPTVAIAQALVAGHFSAPPGAKPMGSTPSTESRDTFNLAAVDASATKNETEIVREQQQTQTFRAGTATSSSASSISLLGPSDPSHRSGTLSHYYYQSIARIGIQVAEALAYAHDRGVIHRDVKPSNLLLDLAGTVWVTDFGLAKEQEDGLTQTGDIVGTLRFMAPERFRGSGDGRSDIYSLGATLYELVTLRPAFQGADHLQLLERVTHIDPVRPRTLDPRLPADLETVILKALDKDPARRYQTASQLAEDLRCFLDYRPIKARRTGWPERTWRWCRRNPIVAGLTSIATALLVVIAVGSSVDSMRLRTQLKRAEDAEKSEIEAHRQSDRALFDAYLQQARAERTSRRPGQRLRSLRAIDAAAKLGVRLGLDGEDRLALRNEVIACLALPDMQIIREWAGWPPGTVHVAFDGGQRRYVRISRAGDVSLREVEGDREVAHFTCATGACTSKFSHDGRYLSLYEDAGHKLRAWDLSADPPRVTVDEVSESDFHWDMSPNSRLMAFADPQGRVKLVDLATGTQTQSLEVGSKPRSLAFHPERRQLAVACGPGIVRICDVDSGAVLAELPHPNAVDALAWHPGGKVLATVARSRYIRLWDVAKQTENWKSSGPRNGGIMVAFNPTGDLLASFDWNSTLRLWNPLIGQQVFQTQIHMSQLNFKIDDDVLSGFNEETGTVGLFHVAAGREYRTLVRAPSIGDGAYHRVAVSPDGRMLAAGMEDGIGFWDFATGAPIEFIPAGTTGCVLFETDGGLLTKGPAGIFRWTFSADPAAPGILRCGAPERIPLPPSKNNGLACSRDGRIIASAHGNGGVVLHRGRRDWLVELAPHADVRFIALSPDEKWAVTGGHNGFGVKVWEAATGKLFRELIPDISLSAVGFSPDGNWLATTGGGVRLWHVNDWSEAAYLGGTAFAFSHDSRLMAVETGQGLVRLLEPATGRVVAQLDDPNRDVAGHMAFSPDNRQLVTSTNVNTGKIHVWNLELIRTRLAEMRFDWDLPSGGANRSGHEFPVAGDRLVDALNEWGQKQFAYGSSLRLVIDQEAVAEALRSPLPPLPPTSVDLLRQGREHVGKREWAQAVVAFEMSLEQQPENDQSLNDLAWLLATCPEAAVRDPSRAVALARKALGVKPDEPNTWNSLGAALYRDERFREAIDALHKAEQLNPGSVFAFNGFFLAMAHHQLGESVPARDWLARSETWLDRHRVELSTEHQDELSRFRREARELIEPEANVP